MELLEFENSDLVAVQVSNRAIGQYWAIKSPKRRTPYVQSMAECKNVELLPTDVVVDIGSFVGEYAMRAAKAGVKHVIAYEPTPLSFEVLSKNLEHFDNTTAINAAVVADDRKEVEFFISRGNGTRNRMDVVKKGRSVKIKAINYIDAIKDATVLKIDVEGAEWSYPIIEKMPSSLRALIIEFHPKLDIHRLSTEIICRELEKLGFKPVFPESEEMFWNRFDKHGYQWSAHRAWVKEI